MKKFLKSLVPVLSAVVLALVAVGASRTVSIQKRYQNVTDVATFTYAASELDSFYFTREAGLSGLSFGFQYGDSVSTTYARIYRIVNGYPMALQAGDSLTALTTLVDATNMATPTGATASTITLAPLADQYLVVIKFAATGNGVTSPNARAEFIKQFSRN